MYHCPACGLGRHITCLATKILENQVPERLIPNSGKCPTLSCNRIIVWPKIVEEVKLSKNSKSKGDTISFKADVCNLVSKYSKLSIEEDEHPKIEQILKSNNMVEVR